MPTSGPHEVAFAIRGPITRADLPSLCARVCSLLSSAGDVVRCDVSGIEPDAVTVDALARLQLAATRRGCSICLCNTSSALLELVELMGLSHVLCDDQNASVFDSRGRNPRKRIPTCD
jgi:ABC-type transporter Mla MlaB component